MSNIDCGACNDLRTSAPDFATNGVSTAVCNSLKNDTGLSKTNGHNNEVDLNDANDCLVGRLATEIEAYDVCEWKDYMNKFIPNLYDMIKAMICSESGLWIASHLHDCQIGMLANGATFSFSVTASQAGSHVVPGQGVSILERRAEQDVDEPELPDVQITYIAGGLAYGTGALAFHVNDFVDADGTPREGNAVWGTTGDTANGNELIYEIRIKRDEYPQVRSFHAGFGQETNGGAYHIRMGATYGGYYAPGQHGGCNTYTGEPLAPGLSAGHLVPDGWVYLQLRMTYIWDMSLTVDQVGLNTPAYFMGMRMNPTGLDC